MASCYVCFTKHNQNTMYTVVVAIGADRSRTRFDTKSVAIRFAKEAYLQHKRTKTDLWISVYDRKDTLIKAWLN